MPTESSSVPALASNYGIRFAAAIGAYLKENNLSGLGRINAAILGELAQRFHEKDKAVKRQKVKLASEEEWLKEIEADPAMKGIDVRKELGRCQFYCKNNKRICTRKTFTNWLLNPLTEKSVLASYEGATSRPRRPTVAVSHSVETPVPGWPYLLRNYAASDKPENEIDHLCSLDWAELAVEVREKILKFA